ncbi:MAG: zf-HC2 domain-containing protein [Hyphomicrobiales bacterium]
MSDRWTDLLSDYVDDELDAASRGDLETHLRGCPDCAAVVADLRHIVARARALPGVEPDADLWGGIEARLRPPSIAAARPPRGWAARHVTFSLPQLAAACLAVAVLSGAAVWYARTSGLRQGAAIAESSPSPAPAVTDLAPAGEPLSSALSGTSSSALPAGATSGPAGEGVEELRRILASGRENLDPGTVRTLEESLTIIDIAIQQARRALDADPHNPYVRAHLDETMRQRTELLNRATMLASAPR